MFAYASSPAPDRAPARPHLRVVGRRRTAAAPHAVRAAAAYCAGLAAGLMAVAAVSAPTGDGGGPLGLALVAITGLVAALAVGRHHATR